MTELQTIAKILAERLLNTTAEGILLTLLFGGLLRLVGRQQAKTRFASWFSLLLAIFALPFFDWSRSFNSASPPVLSHFGLTLSTKSAFFLFAGWAIVAGLLSLRLAVGLWRVHRFRKRCSDVDLAALDPEIATMLRAFVSRHRVRLRVSSDVAVPSVIGFFRPAIIFPVWLLPQLSKEEVAVILPHELAHLRRLDQWTNLAQKIVRTLFFFHPAVWWIDQRLSLEREIACDDAVLQQLVSPRTYASLLISLAQKLQNARGLALAHALVSRMNQMSLRVEQILDDARPGRSGFIKPLIGLGTCLLIVAFGTAPYMPRLIAFQPSRSPQIPAEPTLSASAAGNSDRDIATSALLRQPVLTSAVKAISTAYHLRRAAVPVRPKPAMQRLTSGLPLRVAPPVPHSPEILVILRSMPYDTNSSGVRVLCIWKVEGRSVVDGRHLGSEIIISLT